MDQGSLTKFVRFSIIVNNIRLLIIIPLILFVTVGILTGQIIFACLTLIVSVFIILLLLIFHPPSRNLIVKGNRIQRRHLGKIEELEKAKKRLND